MLTYARDHKHTLELGTLSERKAFLPGLIKKTVVYEDRVEIKYQLLQAKLQEEGVLPEVLQLISSGGPEGI